MERILSFCSIAMRLASCGKQLKTMDSQQSRSQERSWTSLKSLSWSYATGTRKIQLLFIGNAKQPQCFKKKTGKQWGFWYFSNKTAWMTGEIFTNVMETLNAEFQKDGIHATMLLDNFSGHKWQKNKISNIEFILFTPNLTSHVQPADTGIICTLKAHYHQLTLLHSLDCEEAEEDDPFAIDLLTVMQLLAHAWDQVTPATIAACWRHAGILPSSRAENVVKPVAEPVA